MAVLGYARVSTDGQTLDAQTAALKAAGADRLYPSRSNRASRQTALHWRVVWPR
jgi:DNA invertase Pin-like site-specific DNA recombinase